MDNINRIKTPTDWVELLTEKYEIDTLEFKDILGNVPNTDNRRKIAAITSEINRKGELTKLQLLFVLYAECNENGHLQQTSAYYPVEIDFIKQIMTIKAWNRQGLNDGYKTEETMDHICKLMVNSFHVTTRAFLTRHQKVLHNMSQGLIQDIYEKIPAFSHVQQLEESIKISNKMCWELCL